MWAISAHVVLFAVRSAQRALRKTEWRSKFSSKVFFASVRDAALASCKSFVLHTKPWSTKRVHSSTTRVSSSAISRSFSAKDPTANSATSYRATRKAMECSSCTTKFDAFITSETILFWVFIFIICQLSYTSTTTNAVSLSPTQLFATQSSTRRGLGGKDLCIPLCSILRSSSRNEAAKCSTISLQSCS